MDLKFFKVNNKFKKREHQPNPDFYWRIIFSLTSLLILVAFVLGLYLFWEINKQDFSSKIDYKGQAQKIGQERVEQVLDYFLKRTEKSNGILNLPSPVSDPSI
jgi:hypothetical protein